VNGPAPSASGAPFRLTIVIGSLALGGAQRVLAILSRAWVERGWSVTVITFDASDVAPYFPLHPSIQLCRLGVLEDSGESAWRALSGNLHRLSALRRAVRNQAPDLVVSFLFRTNVTTILATRAMGIPVVIAERVVPTKVVSRWWWRALRRVAFPLADAATAQTEAGAAWLRSIGQRKVLVIPNPVLAAPNGPAAPLQRPMILALGRLVEQKGFDILIRAFGRVATAHPAWRLAIFGEGPERAKLASLIEQRRLSARIELPGPTADPNSVLRSADLFVLSSRYEGFPNALCEAMALGLACVTTDCPSGPSTIVRPEIDALLVPNEDEGALGEAMARLMGDAELRARLGAKAKQITERFSLAKILGQWDELFRLALGERSDAL